MNNLSAEVTRILHLSRDEAHRLGGDVVTPVCLALALLKMPESRVMQLLTAIGVDGAALLSALETAASPLCSSIETHGGEVVMNDAASRVMRLSMLEARRARSRTVGAEHIFLALLRVRDEGTQEPFEASGLTYAKVFKHVAEAGGASPRAASLFGAAEDEGEGPSNRRERRKEEPVDENATPMLEMFGTDLTLAAREGLLDPVVGRVGETERVAQILSRRKKNNPILIGEAGVGKSAIVEGLAQRIVAHTAPRGLWDKRIVALDMGSVVAGTKYRGQFEERLKNIIAELKRHKEIIIFIDEIHTLIGAGNNAEGMDAANMLKPALARGEIQCVGATTLKEYHKTIEKDGGLERRFQKVMVRPTTGAETLEILGNLRARYEEHHKVRYTEEALRACVALTERYVTERSFPDKAIDAMDEAGARMSLLHPGVPEAVVEQEQEVESLKTKKQEAIEAQNFELAADCRDRLSEAEKKLEELRSDWEKATDRRLSTVDETTVADVVSQMTGIPLQRIDREETVRLADLAARLQRVVIGQDEAVARVSKAIQRSRLGLKDPGRPIGTFMFVGPTGVGKTYLAQRLAEELFGSRDALIRIDMSEYGEKHTVSRMVGAPPGYVGYEEGGQLTERVRRRPYSIVLLDEIEKAHPSVFNILLQVMDEGRLTDGNGDTIDFKNTILILTSNSGTRELKEFGHGVGFDRPGSDALRNRSLAHALVKKSLEKQFAPEFLNRLDDVIYFDQLSPESLAMIVDTELSPLASRLSERGLTLVVSPEAKAFIGHRGYDVRYGARPLRRTISDLLEDALCDLLLAPAPPEAGSTIEAVVENENIILKIL